MRSDDGIRLEFDSGPPGVTGLDSINTTLHSIGFLARPLDVGAAPATVQQSLAEPALDDAQQAAVRAHFELSQAQLLDVIQSAGRSPQVPGGGDLETYDATNDVHYPQVFVVEPGTDFSRFDRFHVNDTPDGGGLDEILQLVWGGPVQVRQHLPDEGAFTVTVDCVTDEQGWLVTYDGGQPRIGSLTHARPGTKLVVQAIGPATWGSHYVDDDGMPSA